MAANNNNNNNNCYLFEYHDIKGKLIVTDELISSKQKKIAYEEDAKRLFDILIKENTLHNAINQCKQNLQIISLIIAANGNINNAEQNLIAYFTDNNITDQDIQAKLHKIFNKMIQMNTNNRHGLFGFLHANITKSLVRYISFYTAVLELYEIKLAPNCKNFLGKISNNTTYKDYKENLQKNKKEIKLEINKRDVFKGTQKVNFRFNDKRFTVDKNYIKLQNQRYELFDDLKLTNQQYALLDDLLLEEHTLPALKAQCKNVEDYTNYKKLKFAYLCIKNQHIKTYHNVMTGNGIIDYSKVNNTFNDAHININCEFKKKNGKLVVCRDLALENLKYLSKEQILHKNSIAEDYYDSRELKYRFDSAVFVCNNKIGVGLAHIATKNIQFPEFEKTIVLDSGTHAMHLKFSKKTNPERYKVEFIDPNAHRVYEEYIFSDLEKLKILKIENLLLMQKIKHYFPKCLYAMLSVYDNIDTLLNEDINADLPEANFNKSFEVFSSSDQENYTDKEMVIILYFAVRHKVTDNNIIKSIFNKIDNHSEIYELSSIWNDFGVFIEAMQTNNTVIVELIMKHILTSNRTNAEKMKLLECKDKNGYSEFFIAMKCGKDAVVELFMKHILDSNLTNAEKMELLMCKNIYGDGALFIAMRHQNESVIKLFIKNILGSKLTFEEKRQLLSCRNYFGLSVLFVAQCLQYKNIETIFKSVISESSLQVATKNLLLQQII